MHARNPRRVYVTMFREKCRTAKSHIAFHPSTRLYTHLATHMFDSVSVLYTMRSSIHLVAAKEDTARVTRKDSGFPNGHQRHPHIHLILECYIP